MYGVWHNVMILFIILSFSLFFILKVFARKTFDLMIHGMCIRIALFDNNESFRAKCRHLKYLSHSKMIRLRYASYRTQKYFNWKWSQQTDLRFEWTACENELKKKKWESMSIMTTMKINEWILWCEKLFVDDCEPSNSE